MLHAAAAFLALAFIAVLMGLSRVGGLPLEIGQSLMAVFLILSVVSLVTSVISGHGPSLRQRR